MVIKGVIFDLDGTLTDTLAVCVAAFGRALAPLAGRAIGEDEIVATFGPSEEGTVMALAPGRFDEGLAAYLKYYGELLDGCPGVFAGTREILEELRSSGVRLGLVTGKGPLSTEITMKRYGLVFHGHRNGFACRIGQGRSYSRPARSLEALPARSDLRGGRSLGYRGGPGSRDRDRCRGLVAASELRATGIAGARPRRIDAGRAASAAPNTHRSRG